ncbi:MAG: hypothetical protein HY983_01630 [Candidatus Magasanikbacteria bacterium]|nr:hypothetical protein [Candidatus Magasanikbacteria bacterium]
MSNGADSNTVFERFAKLLLAIGTMVVEGKRKAEEVADWLQVVLVRPDFHTLLTAPREARTDTTPEGGWAKEWAAFYQEVFGLTVDFAGIAISEAKPGFGWVVMVPPGLTLNRVWAACRDQFPCYSAYGDDLDKAVQTNDRQATTAYAQRFRNRVEADEELKNLSATDLGKGKVQGITLLERILLELWYFWKTGGGHLDLVNWTLCAGSRGSDGGVPSASCCGYRFQVLSCLPDSAGDSFRTRAAV